MTDDELRKVREQRAALNNEGLPPQANPAPGANLPPEIRVAFGSSFMPAPWNYRIERWTIGTTEMVTYIFEFAHGRVAFPMSDTESQAFIRSAIERTSGLLLPPSLGN